MAETGEVASRDTAHARLMDSVYRNQRHFYDLTRKFYLLGRDHAIARLEAGAGDTVLEVGCGTGRNLIRAARSFPQARFYGFDLSSEMLATARRNIEKAGLADRITLGLADAGSFDGEALFGIARFDRILYSYTLSMIPPWQAAISRGLDQLTDSGRIGIVDFGMQEGLPGWFRGGLKRWLDLFHVAAREALPEFLSEETARHPGRALTFRPMYRGYTWYAEIG